MTFAPTQCSFQLSMHFALENRVWCKLGVEKSDSLSTILGATAVLQTAAQQLAKSSSWAWQPWKWKATWAPLFPTVKHRAGSHARGPGGSFVAFTPRSTMQKKLSSRRWRRDWRTCGSKGSRKAREAQGKQPQLAVVSLRRSSQESPGPGLTRQVSLSHASEAQLSSPFLRSESRASQQVQMTQGHWWPA